MNVWQQKFLKRPADDVDSASDSYEPPVKLQHNGSENLTKFSVEIVQQLEFTTSAANSQPQQISTNVTVKALTNASVKSEGPSPAQQQQQQSQQNPQGPNGGGNGGGGPSGGGAGGNPAAPSPHMHDLGRIVDFKQEPDTNEFADLSAALDKDAAANGHFPGLSDLIGDDTNDDSDAFKDLISDLSDFQPDFLDFEEKHQTQPHQQQQPPHLQHQQQPSHQQQPPPPQQQQQQMLHAQQQQQIEVKQEACIKQEHPSPGMLDNMGIKRGSPVTNQFPSAFGNDGLPPKRGPYGNPQNGPMSELSPAAQTLKHMAEQHQHKNAMGMGFPRGPQPNPQRPPYSEFGQFGPGQDYMNNPNNPGGPGGVGPQFHKGNVPPFPGADMIKQELYSPQNEFDLKPQMNRMPPGMGGPVPGQKMGGPGPGGFNKPTQQQQYSPYGSPAGGLPNHGSPHGPGYIPPRGPGPGGGGPPGANNVGGAGAGGVGGGAAGGPGGPGGAGPGQQANGAGNGVPPRGGPGGPMGGGPPNATMLQMKQTQQLHISQQGPGGHGIQVSAGQHLHLSGDLKAGVSVAAQQGVFFSQQQQQQQQQAAQQQQSNQQSQQPGPGGPQQSQQAPGAPGNPQQQQQGPNQGNPNVGNNSNSNNPNGPNQNNSGNNSNNGNNPQQQQQQPNQAPPNTSQGSSLESQYTVSQSQTINFTQQALRQRQQQQQQQQGNGPGGPGPNQVPQQQQQQPGGPGQPQGPNGPGVPNPQVPQQQQHQPGGPNSGISAGGMPLGGPMGGGVPMSQNPNVPLGMSGMGMGPNGGLSGLSSMVSNTMGGPGAQMMHNSMGPGGPGGPGGPMGMRYMQQQQMIRAQAMQQQMAVGGRPPPPDYKATQQGGNPSAAMLAAQQQQMLHASGGRFPAAMRRITQQPIPPSGPMMRAQHAAYMQQHGHGGPRGLGGFGPGAGGPGAMGGGPVQRPPNVQVGPEGMPMGSQQQAEWRHMMMSQQQSMSFGSSGGNMRAGFGAGPGAAGNAMGMPNGGPVGRMDGSGGAGAGPGGMTQLQMQQQAMMRQQQQQQQSMGMYQGQMGGGAGAGGMGQMQQQMTMMQQQQAMMGQMQMNQIHMSQTQTMSIQQQQQVNQQQSVMNSFNNPGIGPGPGPGGGGGGPGPGGGNNPNSNNNSNNNGNSNANNSSNNNGGGPNGPNGSNNSSVIPNADFSLEFLENLPVGDPSQFNAQDLLSSLDNENFNIQDILVWWGNESASQSKAGKLDDPFYDFLADNDDADKDGKQQKFRKGHLPFCVCSTCRSNRAAKAMEKNMAPNKAIQTADNGPQPDASPVPMGLSQDSCRLCFSTDQLEPLCSGMIVVRDEMLDKIYVCTGVLIIPRPKVSIFICTPCAQLINSFHAYRQQVCSNNQALLRTMALKALKTSAPAPKIQKVAPLPPQKVRKVVSVPIKRKPPVGLIPVIDTPPMLSPQSPPVQYRKIAPKLPMVVEPEVTVVPPIKDEQDDPLEGCGDTTQKVALSMARTSNILVKLQSKPIVVMKKEQPGPALLHLDAEEGQDGLPEGERWQCWHCENSFPFQFECAKHLLQVHEENVGSIKRRLKLDELNANMLQMMSLNQKK